MKYIIIAYYTKNTGYEDEIKNLVESANKFGLDIYTEGIKRFGSWQQHTHYKPVFIKKCLEELKKPVVYLDADAVIRQDPVLFNGSCILNDLSVHYRNGRELLSGTIFLNTNGKILRLLDDWVDINSKFPSAWEQRNLEKLLVSEKWAKEINVFRLPPTYCQIFDTMKDAGDPVIEHFQASRKYKNKI